MQANRVHCTATACRFISDVNLREPRDFVRHGEIDPNKIKLMQKMQRGSQFIRADVKPCVLHVDLERAQRRVLHLRRKRVRHRVAENTQANRWIDTACDLRPFLKIGECVTVGSLLLFFHATVSLINTLL